MIKLYHFFQSLPVIGHCTSAIQLTQTAKPIVVLLPCLPVIKLCDSLQKCIIEKGNWPKKMKAQQRNEVKMPEVKFESKNVLFTANS